MAKPQLDDLAIVTASLDPLRAQPCFASWLGRSRYHLPVYVVWSDLPNQPKQTERARQTAVHEATVAILDSFAPGVTIVQHEGGGVVPAFAKGVASAFREGARCVICLHDDVLLEEDDWDDQVYEAFRRGVKFMGFGGATQLGCASLYQTPYDPMQLARRGFISNMRDAEIHGRRSRVPVQCVCFDGFCQIGTADWFKKAWGLLESSGVQHHFYDGMLGCFAARAGVQPGLMLPVKCHHLGGQTAVASIAYNEWARTQHPDGDQGFWAAAHEFGYRHFQDVLPLSVPK